MKFKIFFILLFLTPSIASPMSYQDLSDLSERDLLAAKALVAGYRDGIGKAFQLDKSCEGRNDFLKKYLSISTIIEQSKMGSLDPDRRNDSVLQFVFNLAAIACHGSLNNFIKFQRKSQDNALDTIELLK